MALIILACTAWGQQAQDPPGADAVGDAVFRGGVSLVRVDALVLDGKRPVTGLEAKDFAVFDEDEPRPLRYFGHASEPVWLTLLLDVSGSMSKRLDEMSAVARRALGLLGPDDRVSVMFFGRKTRVAADLKGGKPAAVEAIGEAKHDKTVGAGTAINPAIIDAADYLRGTVDGPGRRSVVILTDNGGLNYQSPDSLVLEALYGADAVLNAIVTPDAEAPKAVRGYTNPDFTPSDVFLLARETGGEVLKSGRAGEAFQEMLERVRTRYSLHFEPAEGAAKGLRRVRVELTAAARRQYPRAEVRARSAYLVR